MCNQGFDPTERFRKRDDLERFHETAHGLKAANQLETQHGAEARLLGFRNSVSRMRPQAGIMDSAHPRIFLQEFRHSSSRRLLSLDAREQCAQAA